MGNMSQLVTAVTKPQFVQQWSNGSLASTSNGTLLTNGITGLTTRYMPTTGSVYGMSLSCVGTLTSGTLVITPQVNGTPQPAWTLTLGTGGAKGAAVFQPSRKLNFVQGDTLEFLYGATAVLPGGLAVELDAYIVLESVDL